MIPATYPSILDSSNRTKMLVYQVPSITGLTRWVDYIPVKSPTSESDLTLANTFANSGFILTSKVNDITGLVPFKDYVPIYLDSTATKAWSADNDGYIPMAELAGLLLDFTTGSLDSRINFTRTTNATVTNSAGQITYAPHNLLTYSEQFDNAAWTKTGVTVTANQVSSPANTTTMDLLKEDSALSNHYIVETVTVGTGARSFSIYAKQGTGTRYLQLRPSGAGAGVAYANFDLVNGTVVSGGTGGTGLTSATLSNEGNGIYRCTLSATYTSAPTGMMVSLSNGTIEVPSYQGDGTSSIYIWGAQLEVGASPTTYNPTSVKNLLGYSELFDNAAWTKSNSFVQTNLLTYSEAFDNAVWTADATTVTANNTISPNGYQTADLVVPTAVASTGHRVRETLAITPTIGVNYAYSIYAKASGYNFIKLRFGTLYANFNLSTGEVGQTNSTASSIDALANGWFRCTFYGAYASNNTVYAYVIDQDNAGVDGVSFTGNGTSGVYIWGAQLVQGSVAGDYRRTDVAALPVYYPNHNGVVCAEKLVESATTANHWAFQGTARTVGTVYTQSVYIKKGERTWATVGIGTLINGTAWFNLDTGVVGTKEIALTSSSIQSVGNGWYRCSIVYTETVATSRNLVVAVTTGDNVSSYAGDGTSGIYIFGAQLSDSASLDPYVLNAAAAPTAVAYYGARFDYDPVTLAPKGLLIEEQRANLLLNSTIAGTNLATQNVTVTAVAHTLSFYGTGNIVLSGTASATLTGTGTYPTRSTLTFTPTAGTLTLTVTGTVQYAQLEIGAFATSFIPTAASQVTRAADVATIQGSNFYSWYNQNEGSFAVNVVSNSNATNRGILESGSGLNDYLKIWWGGTSNAAFVTILATASQANITLAKNTVGTFYKMAGGYKVNDFGFAVENTSGTPDTAGNTPLASTLYIGYQTSSSGPYLNGNIKSISYYPQKLSSDVLKGLTA